MISRARREVWRGTVLAALLCAAAACADAPSSADALAEADRALEAGEPARAQALAERARAEGAPAGEAALRLGEAALALGDLAQAQRWLGDTGSRAASARRLRAQAELAGRRGDWPLADRLLDQARRAAPRDPEMWPEVWVAIARLRYRSGDQAEALAAADRAVASGPGHPAALTLKAELVRDAQGPAAARAWFERALAAAPHHAAARLGLAATLADAGDARAALATLEAGGARLRAKPAALHAQAVLAARGGNWALAGALGERAGLTAQGVPSAVLLAAMAKCATGDAAGALTDLEALAQAQPDNARVRDLLALALRRAGREEVLIDRYGGAAQQPGASPYLRRSVAQALEALDRRAEAAALLDAAAQPGGGLEPLPVSSGSANGPRDAIRAQTGTETGIATARAFLAAHPGSGDAQALLGDALLAAGQVEGARAAYRQAARVRSNWPLTERMLAATPSAGERIRLLVRALRRTPRSGEAAARLADALAARGRWETAALLLDHALRHGQDRVPLALAARSVAAARLGDRELAQGFAVDAHELDPLSVPATAALAAALPPEQAVVRSELLRKLRSLGAR